MITLPLMVLLFWCCSAWLSVLDRELQLPLSSVQSTKTRGMTSQFAQGIVLFEQWHVLTQNLYFEAFPSLLFSPTLFHAPHLIVVRNRRSPSGGMKWKDWSLALSCMPRVFLTAFGWFLVTDLQVAKSRISICSSLVQMLGLHTVYGVLAGCWLDLQRSLKTNNMFFRISTWECLGSEKAQ